MRYPPCILQDSFIVISCPLAIIGKHMCICEYIHNTWFPINSWKRWWYLYVVFQLQHWRRIRRGGSRRISSKFWWWENEAYNVELVLKCMSLTKTNPQDNTVELGLDLQVWYIFYGSSCEMSLLSIRTRLLTRRQTAIWLLSLQPGHCGMTACL